MELGEVVVDAEGAAAVERRLELIAPGLGEPSRRESSQAGGTGIAAIDTAGPGPGQARMRTGAPSTCRKRS